MDLFNMINSNHKIELMNLANQLQSEILLLNNKEKDLELLDYGLEIICTKHHPEKTSIIFKGIKVLDSNTYIPGTWEELLKEVYSYCLSLRYKQLNDEQKRKIIEEKKNMFLNIAMDLVKLTRADEIEIGNNILVTCKPDYYDDYYFGKTLDAYYYNVYVDNILVFKACDKSRSFRREFKLYEPGLWEEILVNEYNRKKAYNYKYRDEIAKDYIRKLKRDNNGEQ